MKKLFSTVIVASAVITAFCRLPEGWGDRVLPLDGVPLDEVGVETGAVWEFGWTGDKPQQAAYKVYGDTLLCEIADGRREWYAINGDTARWFREETALMRLVTDERVPVVAFGFNGGEGAYDFTATGTYSGDMMLTQRGTVGSSAPVSGTLVIDGDSVGAYMTCERRRFRGSFAANDTLDSLIRYDVVRYRWYRRQERLPIALQCDITVSGVDGREISEYSRAWLADLHREEMDEADRKARDRSRKVGLNGGDGDSGGYGRAGEVSAEEIAGALSQARVTVDGRAISVSFDTPLPGEAGDFSVDVMEPGGILYLHSGDLGGAATSVTIDASALMPGRYVVAVGCGAIVEKRFIVLP